MADMDEYNLEHNPSADASSEPSAFVEKMEVARLARPCPSFVDMRGKVAGICKSYQYGDRIFHMDSASQIIFERRLKENHGVFTQGAYEEITNGEHTLRHIRQKREQAQRARAEEGKAKSNIDIIDFGFYRKREQERYELVTHLVVFTDENTYYGTTKDISDNGLLVLIPLNYTVKSGNTVYLSFYDERNEYITDEDLQKLHKIPYEIRRTIEKTDRLALALQRKINDDDDANLAYLREAMEERKSRLRTDTKGVVSNRSTEVFERYYADSAVSMSLFYGYGRGESQLLGVGHSAGNKGLHNFFKTSNGQYDYSVFNDSRWLPPIIARSLERNSATSCIVTVFRFKDQQSKSWHIISSDQLPSIKLFTLLWAYLENNAEHRTFRLTLNPAQEVPDEQMQEILSPMLQYFPEEIGAIDSIISSVKAVGTLLDLTDSLQLAIKQRGAHHLDSQSLDQAIKSQLPDDLLTSLPRSIKQPKQVLFGYHQQRKEERYVIELKLELICFDDTFRATSLDFSTRGLRVHLENDESDIFYKGQEVAICFTSLLASASINLKKVSYKVVKILEDENQLALVRASNNREDTLIDDFFNSLISRNKDVLDVDAGDISDEILGALYENLMVADLQSVPLFLAKGETGEMNIAHVGITMQGNELLDYLKNSKKQLELGFIDNPDVLGQLMRLLKSSDEGQAEVMILSYRSAMSDELITIPDYEINDREDRVEFIRQMVRNKNYRILQLSISGLPHYTDEDERRILAPIYSQSMSHAKRLKLKLNRLWAIGEINDITREYLLALRSPSLEGTLGRVKSPGEKW
ncbi:Aspartate aminotransferase [hydrothermal vent metagenome]|uniref:Aspartate aminotransferase n=1 Tax=hydrothermal vent metagenome TaxID=652676 RepID=A0A3B0YZ36_9ZZZZ